MRKRDSTRLGPSAPGAGGTSGLAGQKPANSTAMYAKRFQDRYVSDFYRRVDPNTVVSSIGIGTYLGECTAEEDVAYTETITKAISSGVNVIDTAINYRCQRSERAVGAALRSAIAEGTPRDAIVICTKGGYLPLTDTAPSSRDEYRAYLKQEFFNRGILAPDDVIGGGHSLAPSFLRYAIAQSRNNLGVDAIDVYYLHNPEQQLVAVTPASLHERLRAAFMVLEDAADRGQIRSYGCATWNALRVPPGNKAHLGLEDLLTIAQDVAGERHHFRAVQLPINLAMPEAVRMPTQPLGKKRSTVPVLEAATALGLAVFASASLMQAQLTKDLPPSMRELFPDQQSDAQCALAFVRSLPGVTTALVGTKSIKHLLENLESAGRERSLTR